MKIKHLINKLKRLDPDLEVFLTTPSLTGNISELENVRKSTYGFFGESIPCVLLDNSRKSSH